MARGLHLLVIGAPRMAVVAHFWGGAAGRCWVARVRTLAAEGHF